jgi:hypothetical protein
MLNQFTEKFLRGQSGHAFIRKRTETPPFPIPALLRLLKPQLRNPE